VCILYFAYSARGFCFFSNVAIAAMVAKTKYKLERILIVGMSVYKEKSLLVSDWDVHHGNGTESLLLEDPNILFFSTHRYGNSFYPKTGDINTVGTGKGEGKIVNVPFSGGKVGDAEMLSVFYHILLPIALEFNPQLVLVSAGFDAVRGDPLGRFSN
jgi:histone deacetylase 6